MVRIFIVEDDAGYALVLKQSIEHLAGCETEIHLFTAAEECIHNFHLKPHLISLDFNLPGMNGIDFLKKIKNMDDKLPVILVSSQENIEVVISAFRSGAWDYIMKNESAPVILANTVKNLASDIELRQEVERLKEQIIDRNRYSSIIGHSEPVLKVLRMVQKVENSGMTVLLTGESGTGKELVARALHYNSNRRKKPFITVNVAAIPEDLVESELFGHEKGAFTDASGPRIGKFEEANGGTIFLDEIGDMNLDLQAKILRIIEQKEVTRIGSNKTIQLDIRIIAATNRILSEKVKEGTFRQDLLFRLQGFLIHLPPLRNRGDDILLLARHFLKCFCAENKIKEPLLSREVMEDFLEYSWPGNVRELKAVVERATLLSEGGLITMNDIVLANS